MSNIVYFTIFKCFNHTKTYKSVYSKNQTVNSFLKLNSLFYNCILFLCVIKYFLTEFTTHFKIM